MRPLRHIVEPSRLLLTWQPADINVEPRNRRTVAEIVPGHSSNDEWTFKYFLDSPDLVAAQSAGFKGYPAFKLDDREFSLGVRDSLLRRLPPRNRDDFDAFLTVHRLPTPFIWSDLALVGYTGARLPSDGFAFVPEFSADLDPCELILEVAGVRHVYGGSVDQIKIGDPVAFAPEPENLVNSQAIAVFHNDFKLGYVNTALLPTIHRWLTCGVLTASVERKNGKIERPLIYVRAQFNC